MKEASSLFYLLLKSINLSKIKEDPNKEKIILDLLKCSNRFSVYFLEQSNLFPKKPKPPQKLKKHFFVIEKKIESEEILNFALQIMNEILINSPQNLSKPLFLYKLIIFNNYACLMTCNNDLKKSKEQLKSLLKESSNIAPSHFALITNNLSTIYLKLKDYLKAYKYSESGLFKFEPIIFKQMKDSSTNLRVFNKDLMILLQGYLNYAKCLSILQKIPDKISENNLKTQILSKNPLTFYRNGHKLSCKYLGQESFLAKKFLFYMTNGSEKINQMKIETNFDETSPDFNAKSINQSESHHKKNFIINEISESNTQEDSFEKTFDERELSHKKDFRIVKKTHHRNYKSQVEFGNNSNFNRYNDKDYYEIVDKMREMEENLKKIQDLREKYKLEKQMIENDYNYIKTKSFEYFNPQNRFQTNTFGMSPPNNFISNKAFVSSNFENYWHQPVNMMETGNINSYNTMNNPYNNNMNSNLNNMNNFTNNMNNLNAPLNNFMNPILTDTIRNSNLDSEEKGNEFEKLLIHLKKDKDKILKENEEKDQEIQKLREFLKKKEKATKKNLNNSSNNSLLNEEEPILMNTLSPTNQEAPLIVPHHQKSKSNIVKPQKVMNLFTTNTPKIQLPIKEQRESKDFINVQSLNIKNKPKETFLESPQTYKGDLQMNSFNSVSSLPDGVNGKKKKAGIKENSNPKSIESMGNFQDNNAISKKTALLKSESNKTLVTLISIMDKKGSIKNIKTENKRRTSIIDNVPRANTPFDVFKTLVIPRFSVAKKKILIDNEVILLEFRTLINDNNEKVYRIEGYNLETAKAMKTAIMKEDILKKVLDSINYEDIIPLTHPLKSIYKYIDFVKYFIMPFIGVYLINL